MFLLGLWGCLAVYNATVYSSLPFNFAARQFLWLVISICCLYAASRIPFRIYYENAVLWAAPAYALLLLVLLCGASVNGMRGWFSWGNVSLQPSEIAKPFFVLLLCKTAMRGDGKMRHFLNLFVLTCLWIAPVALEPDWGTSLVYLAGFVLVYFSSGGSVLMLAGSALVFALAVLRAMAGKAYMIKRLAGFIDPSGDPFGAGWHVLQFQYAIARGGFWGAGWGKSVWANSYLPLSYSDSSFAALAEAVGFAGSFPVIVFFASLGFAAYMLSGRVSDPARRLVISSLVLVIVFQAFLHISVNVGLIPPTGITLPMVSYGGSSLFSTMISAGIILSAARGEGSGSGSERGRE